MNEVLAERPCLLCRQFVTDGEHIIATSGRCVCPYPHFEAPYNVPWWRTAIRWTKEYPLSRVEAA